MGTKFMKEKKAELIAFLYNNKHKEHWKLAKRIAYIRQEAHGHCTMYIQVTVHG